MARHILGHTCGLAGKESACNAGDLGLIPGLGRSPGEGKGYPLQSSSLENSMGCIVHGVPESWTQLSDFHFHFSLIVNLFTDGSAGKEYAAMKETLVQSLGWEDPPEKEMARHSSIFAWKFPWTDESGGLQFMGSQRARHNRATFTFTFHKLPCIK